MDDHSLVREAQNGNLQAFEELIRRHERGVLRLALRLTESESDAKNIYLQAFVGAYRRLGRFQFASSFSTWIYGSVIKLCMKRLKRRHRQKPGFPALTFAENDERFDRFIGRSKESNTTMALHGLGFRINSRLESLRPCERVIVELNHCHGLTLPTIAVIIGADEQAVRGVFFRAIRKMRAGLADFDA